MTGSAGEMPFLDHLEELRLRILRSLGAVVVGSWPRALAGAAVSAGQHSEAADRAVPHRRQAGGDQPDRAGDDRLQARLPGRAGAGLAHHPVADVGLPRARAVRAEKKRASCPRCSSGWRCSSPGRSWPTSSSCRRRSGCCSASRPKRSALHHLRQLFRLRAPGVLALGLSFELPLIMVILAWLGVVGPGELNRFRRYAIVLAFIAGAVLSPGTDLLSMIMMTVPLLLLYEVGVAGAALVHRREGRVAAGVVLVGLGCGADAGPAQVPVKARPATAADPLRARADSLREPPGSARGSRSTAPPPGGSASRPRRPGASRRPTLVTELLDRPGYQATRYRADSATVFIAGAAGPICKGEALTERQGRSLEADSITYLRDSCILDASGEPHLFDRGQVLVGEGIRYDTCRRRGASARPSPTSPRGPRSGSSAATWPRTRAPAGSTPAPARSPAAICRRRTTTSRPRDEVDLQDRPGGAAGDAYVRDVPILWLPFIFQDLRPGRHSGDTDPAVRVQRPGPADPRLQSAGDQHRLLLGARTTTSI